MLAGGVGMVTGGTLGAGFGAFGSKRAMGKYLKTIDGQVVDVAVLGKTLDGKQVVASKIDDGFIKDKNNVVKKVKGKKDKNIKKSKTVEVLPSESSYIIKQTGKINRTVDYKMPINFEICFDSRGEVKGPVAIITGPS